MSTENTNTITVHCDIKAPIEKVWRYYTEPAHIMHWNFASDDWHTPRTTNDLKVGGHFTIRMESKDGSFGFDFTGQYTTIIPNKFIAYTLEDGRKVTVSFSKDGSITHVYETFETETMHTAEQQRAGWQAILDNLKKYTETH